MSEEQRRERALLEQERAIAQSRVFHALEALDRRRVAVVEVGRQVRRLSGRFVVGASAISAAAVACLGYAIHRVSLRRRERPVLRLLARSLGPPPRRPFLAEAAWQAALSLVGVAVTELATRAVRRLLVEIPGTSTALPPRLL